MIPAASTMEPYEAMEANCSCLGEGNCTEGVGPCPLGTVNCSLVCPNVTQPTIDVDAILQMHNNEKAVHFIPVMILMVVLMVVGVIGNALVVYIYRRRFKKTSSNYFILTMALFDLVVCLVSIPAEIYDLRYPFAFYSSPGCKVFRFTETFSIYGSAIVLLEIAFDRYLKICHPLKVVRLFKIKLLCCLAAVLALLLSTPTAFLYGITRFPTPTPGILGYDCSIAEEYRSTKFQKIYYIVLMIIFFSTFFILTGLYVRIWVEIRRRNKMVIGDQLSKPLERTRTSASLSDNDSCQIRGNDSGDYSLEHNSRTRINARNTEQSNGIKMLRLTSVATNTSRFHVSRTTVVLFAVTVVFVISYLPAIVVMLCRSVIKDFDDTQSIASLVTSKFFSKFTFINNAANPIIYSFLNVHFRQQAFKVVRTLLCCHKRRRTPQKADSDRSTKKEFILA